MKLKNHNKMTLKTLKDLERKQNLDSFICINPIELKQKAIKWIKEDFGLVKNAESHKMLERWKERFNITEKDLK